MSRTSETIGIQLRDAIAAYLTLEGDSVDNSTRTALKRWAKSSAARNAFADLRLNSNQSVRVIAACLQSADIHRTFPRRVSNAKHFLQASEHLERCLLDLRKYVNQFSAVEQRSAVDSLAAKVPSTDMSVIRQGLFAIGERLRVECNIAREDLVRLGATRKSGSKDAPRSAALAWLAASILRIVGSPHYRLVADLGEVVLGGELTVEHVRRAARNAKRQWRLHGGVSLSASVHSKTKYRSNAT